MERDTEEARYTWRWDEAEHARALARISRDVRRRRGTSRSVVLWCGLGLITVIGLQLATDGASQILLVLALVFIGLLIAYPIMIARTPRVVARKVRKQDPGIDHPLEWVVSEEGLRVRALGLDVLFGWDRIHRVVETDDFVLAFIDETCAYYLPRWAIPQGSSDPRALLERYVHDAHP